MIDEPSLEEQRAYYDRWNARYRSGGLDRIDPEIRIRAIRAIDLLRSTIAGTPSILEVGCGTGWLTPLLCEIGSVTAIDLSPTAIEVARGRVSNARFRVADFFAEEFPEAPFDVVVSIETLFYVPDQPGFISKILQLLRPGGHLLLTNINKFVYERRSEIGPPESGQVRRWLSIRETQRLLRPHFKLIALQTVEPRGDLGVLRVVNSVRLNRVCRMVGMEGPVTRAKELVGLGGGVILLAQKPPSGQAGTTQ